MKNRRNIIVAFLLCACLLVGIGYAQVTGMLSISGTARFNGEDTLSNEVTSAVKFQSARAIANCDSATVSGDDFGDMTVVINDAVGTAATFTAQAAFVIVYDTTDVTFPDVTFAAPIAEMTAVAGTTLNPGWAINVEFQTPSTGATINGDGTVTLAPGATVEALVTVTFNNNASGTVFTSSDTANISVTLNYGTVS